MKNRAGFTLTEIILALTILLVVIVSLVTLTAKTVHVTATSDREQAAIQLATDRTDQLRADPNYLSLISAYAGTESTFPTLPGVTRVTKMIRTTSSNQDYITVTVTVAGTNLKIVRTVTVAHPRQ